LLVSLRDLDARQALDDANWHPSTERRKDGPLGEVVIGHTAMICEHMFAAQERELL
jgi:hypothetical protein